VFGNKMTATFGKGADIGAFQLAIVQFGTRSMSSTAVESGNMLDIKGMHALPEYSIDTPRLLPIGLLCKTMADATARREGFLAGSEVSTAPPLALALALAFGASFAHALGPPFFRLPRAAGRSAR
jgi:hypothetical protein